LTCEFWDIDPYSVDPIDKDIITNSSDVRKEFIEMKKDSDIWQLKNEVYSHLDDLKNVDRELIDIIYVITSDYNEKYHFSAEELAPFGI